jgi:hypothetical protein
MERIAEALNVSKSTIGNDLQDFSNDWKNKPKGRGRPKGSKPRPKLEQARGEEPGF